MWPVGARPNLFLCPFDTSSFFEQFFTFWHKKMCQVYLILPVPQPQSQPFLQGALVAFIRERWFEAKIWALSVLFAIGVSFIPSLLSGQSWGKHLILVVHSNRGVLSWSEHRSDKYWTIAPWVNTELGSCQPLVTTFLLTNQYVTLYSVCFYLKTTWLIYIVDSLSLNSWPTAINSCLNEAYLMYAFSP